MRVTHVSLLVLFAAGACSKPAEPPPRSATIAPAPARPAPLTGSASTIGREPIITTSGSPPPNGVLPNEFENVTIRPRKISLRSALPQGSNVFRLISADGRAHRIAIETADGREVARAAVQPGSPAILQVVLTERNYRVVCTTEGHRETARFSTYHPR